MKLLRNGLGRADATLRASREDAIRHIVAEEVIEKQKQPAGSIVKQSSLIE